MEDNTFFELPKRNNSQSRAFIRLTTEKPIDLTDDEVLRLNSIHDIRTELLNQLMKIDAEQERLRMEIRERSGCECAIFIRMSSEL